MRVDERDRDVSSAVATQLIAGDLVFTVPLADPPRVFVPAGMTRAAKANF
jgi:hypothetical protein